MAPPLGFTCAASSGTPSCLSTPQRLGGEGLIQLNQIHIVNIESRPLQHFTHRRYRPQSHQARFDTRRRHRHDTRPRREPPG